jgi:hypothetical protein
VTCVTTFGPWCLAVLLSRNCTVFGLQPLQRSTVINARACSTIRSARGKVGGRNPTHRRASPLREFADAYRQQCCALHRLAERLPLYLGTRTLIQSRVSSLGVSGHCPAGRAHPRNRHKRRLPVGEALGCLVRLPGRQETAGSEFRALRHSIVERARLLSPDCHKPPCCTKTERGAYSRPGRVARLD